MPALHARLDAWHHLHSRGQFLAGGIGDPQPAVGDLAPRARQHQSRPVDRGLHHRARHGKFEAQFPRRRWGETTSGPARGDTRPTVVLFTARGDARLTVVLFTVHGDARPTRLFEHHEILPHAVHAYRILFRQTGPDEADKLLGDDDLADGGQKASALQLASSSRVGPAVAWRLGVRWVKGWGTHRFGLGYSWRARKRCRHPLCHRSPRPGGSSDRSLPSRPTATATRRNRSPLAPSAIEVSQSPSGVACPSSFWKAQRSNAPSVVGITDNPSLSTC